MNVKQFLAFVSSTLVSSVLLCGHVQAATHPPQQLRAGPVTLTLADGELRYLRANQANAAVAMMPASAQAREAAARRSRKTAAA